MSGGTQLSYSHGVSATTLLGENIFAEKHGRDRSHGYSAPASAVAGESDHLQAHRAVDLLPAAGDPMDLIEQELGGQR
jgi:hypothetical protein